MVNFLREQELKTVGQIGPNTLIHGDCLRVMPYLRDASVDCVIADPPYG